MEAINALILEWKPRLLLQDWDIEVAFDQKTHVATCEAQPQYMAAKLNFNLPKIAKEVHGQRELEELVVHELTHILLWTACNMWQEEEPGVSEFVEEHTTTWVSKALVKTKYGN